MMEIKQKLITEYSSSERERKLFRENFANIFFLIDWLIVMGNRIWTDRNLAKKNQFIFIKPLLKSKQREITNMTKI